MEDALAPGNGGAEARARSRQHDYAANSNLVLDPGTRDARHEPTGEPATLRGRIDARRFGDRAVQTRPPELDHKSRRGKHSRGAAYPDPGLPRRDAKRARREDAGVLSLAESAAYEPRTEATRAAYAALLGVIQRQLGGQPPEMCLSFSA